MKKHLLVLICLFAFTKVVLSQHYVTDFGQNRIQYRTFDWKFYSTAHFDIYYYTGGKDYADQTLDFLEEEYTRLTDLLGYAPYSKTKIFIYNSINELQQSNKGIDGTVFTIGGQTDFVKLQVEIAHPGNAIRFREELIYKLARVLIEDMLFGGSLAEIFQSAYFLTLPYWYVDGAARYLAFGWSAEMDDFIRDYLSNNKVRNLIKVEGDKAGLVGQAVWNFIVNKYGRSNMSNILNLTRIIRDEENSISSTLGTTYKLFLSDWKNYYNSSNEEINLSYISVQKDEKLVDFKNDEIHFNKLRFNSDYSRMVYSTNNLGKFKILVKDLDNKNSKVIFKGGVRTKGQPVDYSTPLVDWVDEQTLGIVYFHRGYLRLRTHNLSTGEKLEKPLRQFNQIKSISFNENGRLALISGDVDGMNDIFLVSMRRNSMKRLSFDLYDDLDPSFIPGSSAIVFSSNRTSDSLKVSKKGIEEVSDRFNIFMFDLDTSKTQFTRLTNGLSKNTKPLASSPEEIYFLSDQRGIDNLFKFHFRDSTIIQVTNFDKSIKDYDLALSPDGLLFSMLNDSRDRIYFSENYDLDISRFTPETARQRQRQARVAVEIYNNKLKKEELDQEKKDTEKKNSPLLLDTLTRTSSLPANVIDTDNYAFGEFLPAQDVVENKTPEILDTENFVFETETSSQLSISDTYRQESFFTNYQKLEISNSILGPLPYLPQFSFDNLITSFAVDPIRGFGFVLETRLEDLLGNHRFVGGLFATNSALANGGSDGDLYGQYEFLKYWLDFKVRFDRRAYSFSTSNEDVNLRQRYHLNKIKVSASLPVTNWFRVESNFFFAQTHFRNLHFQKINIQPSPDQAPDSKINYGGVEGKIVLDNTIDKGYNLLQGTRASFELAHFSGLSDVRESFSQLRVDLRHYQKIHRELTWANRVFYGNYFGNSPKNYMAGGQLNWLFFQQKNHNGPNPLEIGNTIDNSDLLLSEFTTNLRGFKYNEKFGESSLIFNSELRFPVFDYFSRAPISSAFLRNFLIVGFVDLGSAWTGSIPLSSNQSNTEIIYNNDPVFTARISNFRNPWLASYGGGIRTVIFNYYTKIDYAIPYRDGQNLRPQLNIGIGLDF